MTGLADALHAEHAAIFGYGVVGAHLTGGLRKAVQQAEEAHRGRRDQLLERLASATASASAAPPGAEPAYPLPFAVTDAKTALALA
ncbi:MAG: DUF4439 domain-containing protein, partial [Micromonosporaceae bacterium]